MQPSFPGSPPHTREELSGLTYSVDSMGITPAYAGRIIKNATLITSLKDHPRIRGKNNKKCDIDNLA